MVLTSRSIHFRVASAVELSIQPHLPVLSRFGPIYWNPFSEVRKTQSPKNRHFFPQPNLLEIERKVETIGSYDTKLKYLHFFSFLNHSKLLFNFNCLYESKIDYVYCTIFCRSEEDL